MSTNLTSTAIKDTYDQLLHISDGPTAATKIVYSGAGVSTALKLGTGSASVDNIELDGNTISTLDTNGNLVLSPNGTGSVSMTKVDINGGTIDGTVIGGTTPAAGTFSDLVVSGNNYPSAGSLSNRNKIINGNFGVNQRAVSGTVTLSAGVYGHDRWKAGASGCTYTFATSANVTTITISAGSLVQVIEGLNLQSGTHVLSWTGTVQMKIDGGSAGNSGMTGTLTGGTNATVETSGTGTLSLVQLEAGDTATPFEMRTIGQELALCQRYYSIFRPQARSASAGFMVTPYYLPVKMRATPTLTQISAGNSNLASIQSVVSEYDTGGYFQINATGANGYVLNAIYSASAEL